MSAGKVASSKVIHLKGAKKHVKVSRNTRQNYNKLDAPQSSRHIENAIQIPTNSTQFQHIALQHNFKGQMGASSPRMVKDDENPGGIAETNRTHFKAASAEGYPIEKMKLIREDRMQGNVSSVPRMGVEGMTLPLKSQEEQPVVKSKQMTSPCLLKRENPIADTSPCLNAQTKEKILVSSIGRFTNLPQIEHNLQAGFLAEPGNFDVSRDEELDKYNVAAEQNIQTGFNNKTHSNATISVLPNENIYLETLSNPVLPYAQLYSEPNTKINTSRVATEHGTHLNFNISEYPSQCNEGPDKLAVCLYPLEKPPSTTRLAFSLYGYQVPSQLVYHNFGQVIPNAVGYPQSSSEAPIGLERLPLTEQILFSQTDKYSQLRRTGSIQSDFNDQSNFNRKKFTCCGCMKTLIAAYFMAVVVFCLYIYILHFDRKSYSSPDSSLPGREERSSWFESVFVPKISEDPNTSEDPDISDNDQTQYNDDQQNEGSDDDNSHHRNVTFYKKVKETVILILAGIHVFSTICLGMIIRQDYKIT